jgi:hypothetical protein
LAVVEQPDRLRSAIKFGAGAVLGVLAIAATAVGIAVAIPEPTSLGAPTFVDETDASGIDHSYEGPFEHFVGGGVAVLDCNDDGLPDLFLAGGTAPSHLYVNESEPGGPISLAKSEGIGDLDGVSGAYPLLLDGDEHVDLVVLRVGENVVLRGTGNCGFERANEAWGVDGGAEWTAAFSAAWDDGDDLPTLAFGNYLDLEGSGDRFGECEPHRLLRPRSGSGYQPPEELGPGWCTLSLLFSDWSRSGRQDLRATNDRHYYIGGQEQLWQVLGTDGVRAFGEDDGWEELRIWGMGIASQDLDADGIPEVFLTSQGDNKLEKLADDADGPTYRNVSLAAGVTAHRPFVGGDVFPSTAWHAEFDDVNNDGWMDLFVAKGNVSAQEGFAIDDPNNLLLGTPDGVFVEGAAEAGTADMESTRGGALVDLNGDGMLDLVTVNREAPARVWRNVGAGTGVDPAPMGHFVSMRLRQPAPNVGAVGAWVEVDAGRRTTAREVVVGGGHAGGDSEWIHVGVADAERARVRVTWPDGEVGPWQDVEVDTFAEIRRGANPSVSR